MSVVNWEVVVSDLGGGTFTLTVILDDLIGVDFLKLVWGWLKCSPEAWWV